MSGPYDHLTSEQLDEALAELIDEQPASALLSVPGVAEVLLEHFNNEILERALAAHPADES